MKTVNGIPLDKVFIELVQRTREVRRLQKLFFKKRSSLDRDAAIKAEKELDSFLDRVAPTSEGPVQQSIFS